DGYKNTFDRFVGPTEVFVCGDTLQVKDYSKYHWTMFDPGEKKTRHDETFGDYLSKAYDLGQKLV
ncbi:MAG: flavodoxin family protein, partial [Clostridia bacterium]|nr:flavodoxin family protein [Clostridia bacterium]